MRNDVGRLRGLGYPVDASHGPAGGYRLAAAARDRERIPFGYADHTGTASQRRAEPYRLVTWGRRWYLVAWDADRHDDWRTFRADRISEPAGLAVRFAPREPPAADLGEYVSRNARQAQARFTGELVVHTSACVVAERMV